jgi:hypothetical protein
MSAEKFLTKVFNKAAEFAPFRWVVRNSGKLVRGFYGVADTSLIVGPRIFGEHPTHMQDAAGALFLAVDWMLAKLDRDSDTSKTDPDKRMSEEDRLKYRRKMSLVYLAAAIAFGASGMNHDGWALQLISAAIIAGKATGHLVQSFNGAATPEGQEKKKGIFAKYPVVSTVLVDMIGKTLFGIGAIVGARPDLMLASGLDMGGTVSSLGLDKSLKEIVKNKDEEIARAKAAAPPTPGR